MDIGEVSKASGLPPSTLRYYEEKGLIESKGRNGLRRIFSPSVVQTLAIITLGRKVGFSLDEIHEIFNPDSKVINREKLLEKAEELDNKIHTLSRMRDGLKHAAACKAPSHFECPKFLRVLNIASKQTFRPKGKLDKS